MGLKFDAGKITATYGGSEFKLQECISAVIVDVLNLI